MNPHIIEVPLEKSYRLINHGPTVLVSAHHNGVDDVMTAAWACALDFTPSKLMVVLDKMTATRTLIENSGTFVIQVPCAAQLKMTHFLGTHSLKEMPDKLEQSCVELFRAPGHSVPLVAGCTAWMVCKLIPEPHNHQAHDLFIGEIVAAWADDRVFQNGHWSFETSPPEYRSLHYIAGGQFYAIGESLVVPGVEAS